ncbi:MAG: REP-associated tyrosine transposase [Sphingomonadales bacterium]|nr:REP-associated tyrosine transposase [Sphingomonadales bacterium]
MARLARFVVPGIPHHVTQRGNGRAQVFFRESDHARYRDWLAQACRTHGVEAWAWVLMPNHVHLVLVPSDADGLRRVLAPLHRRYAGFIHARTDRCGHFWQGRFGCVAMDEAHLAAAVRYILLNPVRARLVPRAADWRWSSVHAHLGGIEDGLTTRDAVANRYFDLAALLEAGEDLAMSERLRRAERTGRPVGDRAFCDRLAAASGRRPEAGRPGRKPKAEKAR